MLKKKKKKLQLESLKEKKKQREHHLNITWLHSLRLLGDFAQLLPLY